MPFAPGTQLGHFEVRSLLGAGGMGEVYLAYDLNLKRAVALKVLPEDFAADNKQRMGRFTQEARTASGLNHPNLVHIYEIGDAANVCYIAMEYIEGQTLRQRLAQSPMTLFEVLDVGIQVAAALAAAHQAGVVHRDLKAENIILSRDGFVKVLDFGLAKMRAAPSAPQATDHQSPTVSEINTAPGVVMGTAQYMSPEQARGLEVDERTDIWALGVVLYELLAGRTPFDGPTPSDVIASILKQDMPPLSRFCKTMPEALDWLITKALTKDREGRYQTAKELLTDLQRLKQRLEVEAELKRTSFSEAGASSYSSGENGLENSAAPPLANVVSGSVPANAPAHRQSSAEYLVGGLKRHKKFALAALLVLVCLVLGVVFAAWSRLGARVQRPPIQRALVRLTSDFGLQLNPSWSPDGRFVAYSADRKGNFDIWVQQVDGGNPIQVTFSQAHDWQPDWSPDGKSIVFRSEREGGGLFIVPAFGGLERKISSFGYRPRWSPDGSRVLLLSSGQRIYDFPKVYTLSLDGAPPREIRTMVGENKEEGVRQGSVAWHPDGRRISFLTMDGTFWTVPVEGGPAVKSALSPEVDAQLKQTAVKLGDFRWEPSGKALFFEGRARGVLNLWRVAVDPQTLDWTDGPERLTTGIGQDTDIALSPDGKKLAFTNTTQSTRVWLLPFEARAGQVKGPGQPVTRPDANAWFVDLSRGGRRLVYSMHKYGMDKSELWERLPDEEGETLLAADDYYRFFPRWSPDEKRLAYSRFQIISPEGSTTAGLPKGTEKAGPIVLLDRQSGQEQFLTSPGPWLDYMSDWSPDGQSILGSTNRNSPDRWEICLFPLSAAPRAETQMRVVFSDPENSLWNPRFSPDGRWVIFVAQKTTSAAVSIVYVVPAAGGTPTRITDARAWADWPRWSPDGKTIYFVLNNDSSFINVWGVRFDAAQGTALGEPFRVTSYESPTRMISTQLAHTEMSLSEHRLALPMMDVSGSIWVLDNIDQ